MTSENRVLRGWLIAIVIVHAAVALWHGVAHQQVPVPLTPWQTAFVAIVIVALPLLGVGLLWTKRTGLAAWLIAISMFASLVFGLVNHFLLDSPDNVTAVPDHAWRHTFVFSAALVAVTETIGAVLGAVAAIAWRKPSSAGRQV